MWKGWIWSAGRWQAVCAGDDLGQCHRRLNKICSDHGITKSTHAAMTTGAPPTFTPETRSARKTTRRPAGKKEAAGEAWEAL